MGETRSVHCHVLGIRGGWTAWECHHGLPCPGNLEQAHLESWPHPVLLHLRQTQGKTLGTGSSRSAAGETMKREEVGRQGGHWTIHRDLGAQTQTRQGPKESKATST